MSEKKSREISEKLRMEIMSGKFDVTRRLPSEHQLMKRFSAARETVRVALRELLDRHLVDRQPGRGTYLADRAEAMAAQRFGIIMPDAYYPFYARISAGIEQAAKRHGWTTLAVALGSGDMRERAIKAAEFAEVCVHERVCGVFFQPLQVLKDGERFNRAILRSLSDAGIPVVLIDSDIVTPPGRSEYDLVGIDNTQAGYVLAKHVISRGAKRVWYFSNSLPAPTSLKRGDGVGMAVGEAGLKWTRENIFFADPTDVRAARRLFAGKNRPDAIVAVNDHIATILLRTLNAIGKSVPQDVLLAGFNGDPCATECTPPITTMRQPCHEIGETAVELMLRRMSNASLPAMKTCLAATLVERVSTSVRPDGKRKGCGMA